MAILKQSTARTRVFLMVDSADHITGKTGLTVTLTLSKNGGAFGAAGGAVSEIGSGWYSVAYNTTDTNTVGDLANHATATGADPTDWSDEVSARLLDDLSILDAAAIRAAVGLASANLDTQLSAIAGFIDTEVAAILADTNDIQTRLPAALVGGRMDSSVGAMVSGIVNRAALGADTGLQSIRSGTAQAGTANDITLDAGASALDNFYKHAFVYITGGLGVGQVRYIDSYAGATKVATVAAWTTNPDNTSTFAILPVGLNYLQLISNIVGQFIFSSGKVQATIVAAGDFSQGAADKVWSSTSRTLTSLGAALVQEIWDRATANLTTVGSIGKLIVDNLNATITSVKALLPAALVGGRMDSSVGAMASGVITAAAHAPGAIDAAASASDFVNEIRDAITGAAVDGATTVAESLRLSNSALGGKSSGHETGSPIYRNPADSKNRITATTDANKNRTAVTLDLT